jgi:hypothetical protein
MSNVDYRRSALRVLFILVKGSTPAGTEVVPGFDRVFKGETRVQALDFWTRNPDYFADELLTLFEQTGHKQYLVEAERIFTDEEPDMRRVPMLRRYFGAYEPLDTVLGILSSRELVVPRSRKMEIGKDEHEFLVGPLACDLVSRIAVEVPGCDWYDRRVDLVLKVANGRGGFVLKKRQHQQKEYHDAQIDDLIPTTAERVRKRLQNLLEKA